MARGYPDYQRLNISSNQLKSERYRNGILLDPSIEKLRIHGNRVFPKIRPSGETVNCFFSFC